MEIFLAALAEAILSLIANDLAQRTNLITLREKLRGNSPEKLALQRALVKAYVSFKRKYPELTVSFFDEYFLQQSQVIFELAKLLTPNEFPDKHIITQLWETQFGINPKVNLDVPLSYFLNELREKIKSEAFLKPFVDSRALEQLHIIAGRSEQQVTLQQEMRNILLEILNLISEQRASDLLESRIDSEKSNKDQQPTLAEQYQIALRWAENGRQESMYGFDLSGCVLWGVDFERADLRMANLRNADLGRANLQKANLSGADLRGASLFNAFLHGARIDKDTQIDDKWRLVLEIVQVDGGAKNRELSGIDLSNAILVWGELSAANLSGANLSGSNLNAAKLRNAKLTGTNLIGADLQMADLHGVDLHGANLNQADLRQADLSEADLRGANLSGATLIWDDSIVNSVFPGNLAGAKYNNSTIWPENFNPTKWGIVFQS